MSHSNTSGATHRVLESEVLHGRSRMVGEGSGRGGGIGVILAGKSKVGGLIRGQEMSGRLELRIQIVLLLAGVMELRVELRMLVLLLL